MHHPHSFAIFVTAGAIRRTVIFASPEMQISLLLPFAPYEYFIFSRWWVSHLKVEALLGLKTFRIIGGSVLPF